MCETKTSKLRRACTPFLCFLKNTIGSLWSHGEENATGHKISAFGITTQNSMLRLQECQSLPFPGNSCGYWNAKYLVRCSSVIAIVQCRGLLLERRAPDYEKCKRLPLMCAFSRTRLCLVHTYALGCVALFSPKPPCRLRCEWAFPFPPLQCFTFSSFQTCRRLCYWNGRHSSP